MSNMSHQLCGDEAKNPLKIERKLSEITEMYETASRQVENLFLYLSEFHRYSPNFWTQHRGR